MEKTFAIWIVKGQFEALMKTHKHFQIVAFIVNTELKSQKYRVGSVCVFPRNMFIVLVLYYRVLALYFWNFDLERLQKQTLPKNHVLGNMFQITSERTIMKLKIPPSCADMKREKNLVEHKKLYVWILQSPTHTPTCTVLVINTIAQSNQPNKSNSIILLKQLCNQYSLLIPSNQHWYNWFVADGLIRGAVQTQRQKVKMEVSYRGRERMVSQ